MQIAICIIMMYSPFASASILYTTPRKAAGHGRGGVLKYPFDSGT